MTNFGWDLPPGCSQNDIDAAFGADEDESEQIDPGVECTTCHRYGSFDPKEFQRGLRLGNGTIDQDVEATFTCAECLEKQSIDAYHREYNPLEGIDGYHNQIGGYSCPACHDQGCYQCLSAEQLQD